MPIPVLTDQYPNGAIILDAGSSGTRVLVYRWKSPRDIADPLRLPEVDSGDSYPNFDGDVIIRQVINHAYKPAQGQGPETPLAKHTRQSVGNFLRSLLAQALTGYNNHENCTLTIMSTGGVRNLLERSQKEHNLLESGIIEFLRTVQFRKPRYETISGKKEALYGWIAANYVMKHLPRPGLGIRPGLVGYMEMGGATLQIAYQPAANELRRLEDGVSKKYHGRLLRVKIWGEVIDLFVKSFTLGSDTAWERHNTALMKLAPNTTGQRKDPCRPINGPKLGANDQVSQSVVGAYNQNLCEYLAFQLLKTQMKDDPNVYPAVAPPAAVPDYERASIEMLKFAPWNPTYGGNTNRQFVGGAHFWYTTRSTFGCDAWGFAKEEPYTVANLKAEVAQTGAKTWDVMSIGMPLKFAERALFNAAWVTTVLYDGLGFNRQDPNITFQPYSGPTRGAKDDRPEMVWPLGVAVLDAIGRARPKDTLIGQILPHTGRIDNDPNLYDSHEKAGAWDSTTDWLGMPGSAT